MREGAVAMPVSWMRCASCGGTFPIRRSAHRKRPRGHVKTMWCPWCRRVTPHVERY